jgi:hypothetical protein
MAGARRATGHSRPGWGVSATSGITTRRGLLSKADNCPGCPGYIRGPDTGGLYTPVSPLSERGDRSMNDESMFEVIDEAAESVSKALWGTLRSPNEYDSNGEAANVVDGLYAIARAIHHLARAHEGIRTEAEHDAYHAAAAAAGPFPEPENRGRVQLRIPEELVAPRRRSARNGSRP